MGKLCAKYQLCAIHTADNTDGKSRKSIVSEKIPSFRPVFKANIVLETCEHKAST